MTDTMWSLYCSACTYNAPGERLASVCPDCSQPLMVRMAPVARSRVTADAEQRIDLRPGGIAAVNTRLGEAHIRIVNL